MPCRSCRLAGKVKRRPLEETLLALRRARETPQAEESHQELVRVLRGEGSHAVARALELAALRSREEVIVVNLSGRGDKDAAEIARLRGEKY